MPATRWLNLDGAANARDVAGLPLTGGAETAGGRLFRSDNLQDLSARDVRTIVDELDVRTVVDLRMQYEVDGTGAGPLTHEPTVEINHLSLYRDQPQLGQGPAAGETVDQTDVLPWQRPAGSTRPDPRSATAGTWTGVRIPSCRHCG